MISANSNVTRFMVEESNSSMLEFSPNETEANLRAVLEGMGVNREMPHDDLIGEEKTELYDHDSNSSITDCLNVPTDGIIILNMLGRLANDLFEVAFAKRLAEQLGCGWDVMYRSFWAPAFPTDRTDVCFPNALARKNNRIGGPASEARQIQAIRKIESTTDIERPESFVPILFEALTYNELEPEKHKQWDNTGDRANNMTQEWINSLGETALSVNHMGFPLYGDHVDQLVLKLRDPASPVKVVSLGAFFIHFDWMRDWMVPISNWLYVDPSCCLTPTPPEGVIVIHIRDFGPGENGWNKNFQVGVYRDIIERYWEGDSIGREVLVICQPGSINTDLVQDLVTEFGAIVQTGEDNIDAFCILSSAKSLFIASTSSTFSQMAALLAEQKNEGVQVHYPTHTLDNPPVTLNVSSWKYHLTNTEQNGIAEFDAKVHHFSQS